MFIHIFLLNGIKKANYIALIFNKKIVVHNTTILFKKVSFISNEVLSIHFSHILEFWHVYAANGRFFGPERFT
jgi:hypothetical protein